MTGPADRSTLARPTAEAALCAAVAWLAVFTLRSRLALGLSDEGFQYLLSQAWAEGSSLFARFRLIYPGGQYAALGALMRLFGDELWVLRLGQAAFTGAGVGLLYAAVRRFTATPWLPACLAAAAAVAGARPEVLLAAAIVTFAALRLAAGVEERRSDPSALAAGPGFVAATAFASGALAGFREDSAVLAAGVALVAVTLRRRPRELVTLVVPGLLSGFAPWVLLAAARGDAAVFARHALHRLAFLVERLGQPTELSAPGWSWPASPMEAAVKATPLVAPVPLLIYGGLLAFQLVRRRRGRASDPRSVAAGLLGLVYLPQFLWERPDVWHLRTHLPILWAVVAVAATRLGSTGRRRVAALLAVAAFGSAALWIAQRALAPVVPYPSAAARRIGAGLSDLPPWAGLPRRPGDTLLVLGWGPGWYVLEGIDPGSRHLSTHPHHLDAAARRELRRDLARPTNRWTLVPTGLSAPPPDLVALVEARYREVARWQQWVLYERRFAGPDDLERLRGRPLEEAVIESRHAKSAGTVGGLGDSAPRAAISLPAEEEAPVGR